jgi:transcriptional regulator with PAS, ATPase and Fis domain
VLIYGESGTGKELIAKTIHQMGDRHGNAFVPVNCGAVPKTLFESEFFGYKKGAFTGAHEDKHGFFDLAHRGTLFLDEVGELPLNKQVKLLRAIDGGGYTPVGDNKIRKADIRIVAATNSNLTDMVKKKLMREDFFFRIHVIIITVPPLKDHKEDIPLLVEHFLESYGNGKRRPTIPRKIMEAFYNYDWPGNVRELQNVLQRYITVKHLDFMGLPGLRKDEMDVSINEFEEEALDFRSHVQNFEKRIFMKALEKNQWNKAKAASMLGLPRRTFFRKLQNFGLT